MTLLGVTAILSQPLKPKTANHKTTLKHSKQSHYILTDNILLSTIEKIATSYHTQPNFLPKQKNSSGN
ncbi:hypothetical protein BSPLISOX_466 [uncultured Gammaproteobacteria bacterium]|nr:hypothetical protein BSPLISOX_466 [uncultured Gammaproteobacteria bacterium]